jgi:CHAD domain-containing protein
MNASRSRDKLWQKRLNELSAVWPDFVNGRTTGLHKTRVASRRIREALPIIAVAAPPDKVKKLSKKMRALTRYLGPIRELDVELDMLDHTPSDAAPERVIEMVRREVATRRKVLREGLADNAPVGDVRKLLKKLERVGKAGQKAEDKAQKEDGKGQTPNGDLDAQWHAVLAARLVRRTKALDSAVDGAGPLYAPERLHNVRIAAKKLRYTLEIAQDASVPGAAALVRALKRHQERLGRLHDVQMLLRHVRETEGSPAFGARVNDLAAFADALDRRCRKLHADFVEHRGELASITRDVRHRVVSSLTTPSRRQAHVNGARASAGRATTLGASKNRRASARARPRAK